MNTLNWITPVRTELDLKARYHVRTNDGATENWSGALLYARMRPEFVVGRAVEVAKIEQQEIAA